MSQRDDGLPEFVMDPDTTNLPAAVECSIRDCGQPGKEVWSLSIDGQNALVTFCCLHHVAATILVDESDGRWEGCQHIGGVAS